VNKRTTSLEQANRVLKQEICQRQRVEAELSRRERQFSTLVENSPNLIFRLDCDLRHIYISSKVAKESGIPIEKFLGKTGRELGFDRDACDVFEAACHQAIATKKVTRVEYSMAGKHYISRLIPEQTADGIVESLMGITEDITERKTAEQALQQSEARFQGLATNIPGVIYQYVLHADGSERFTYVSQGCREIYELEPDELLRDFRVVWAKIHPDDVEALQLANTRSTQTLEPFDIEFRLITPSGRLKWIHAQSQPQRQENGDLIFDGLVMDITDRKVAEQKIHEQATLLDIASDAIFVRDLEHHILFWNSGAECIFGWTAAEALGKKITELACQKIIAQTQEAMNIAIESGSWQGELLKVTKSGKEVIVDSRMTLVRDEEGNPKSILTVDTDITAKKQLEIQFYRIQRLESLGTLASGIAHDMNNILTPIMSSAQLLPLKFPDLDQQNQRLLKVMADSARRGAELVKQILLFARGEPGKRVELNIKPLLMEIESIIKETFPRAIEIHINKPGQLSIWTVSADPTQIYQVLMNLCLNARDAMPDGGILTISAENRSFDQNYVRMNLEAKVGDYLVLTVSDTGCGIPKDIQERIFEPFFTSKESDKGTGLGLSTVIGIVKNHGGFVNLESEVGKGSQFQVCLPASNTTATQFDYDCEIFRGNGELILLVDNEAPIREITKTSLINYDYQVLTARDGIEAFSLYDCHQDEIDLVLMDIQMPSISGINAIRVLRQINPALKIIAVSGLASNRKLLEELGIKVQAFLGKPYTIHELLATIQVVRSCPVE
jgi:PAS domain S-box-containing protein